MAKKVLIGKVISNKMLKTVVIEVERLIRHPIYKKIIKRTKKIKADLNGHEAKIGESVRIEQTRPISREKHFKVVEILKV